MEKQHLKRLYQLIVSSHNFDTFLEYLEHLVDEASNIRNNIGKDDSFEVRKGMVALLQTEIDRLKRVRDNINRTPGIEDDDI